MMGVEGLYYEIIAATFFGSTGQKWVWTGMEVGQKADKSAGRTDMTDEMVGLCWTDFFWGICGFQKNPKGCRNPCFFGPHSVLFSPALEDELHERIMEKERLNKKRVGAAAHAADDATGGRGKSTGPSSKRKEIRR